MNVEKELLKEIIDQTVDEEVYAGTLTTTVAYKKAKGGTIPDGYEGIVVSVAVSYLAALDLYLKRADKHVYADGLPTLALSKIAQTAGIDDEVPLLVKFGEKVAWELGFAGAIGSVNWRLRIRLFKKT